MKPNTHKVLQRLAYQHLLLVSGILPRRRRITLRELLEAGVEEPRVFQVLPAILLHNPKILYRITQDLPKHRSIKKILDCLNDPASSKAEFFGIPVRECRQTAQNYGVYLQSRRRGNRQRLFNLRLNEEDWRQLHQLSETLGTGNHSETIRSLIREKCLLTAL